MNKLKKNTMKENENQDDERNLVEKKVRNKWSFFGQHGTKIYQSLWILPYPKNFSF